MVNLSFIDQGTAGASFLNTLRRRLKQLIRIQSIKTFQSQDMQGDRPL